MQCNSLELALLLARVILGILFFYQGYDKVVNVKLKNVVNTSLQELKGSVYPPAIIKAGSYINSYLELIGGVLLIIGLFKMYVLLLLGLNLVFIAIAMSSISAFWKMEDYFPRLALLLFTLSFTNYDCFGLDSVIGCWF